MSSSNFARELFKREYFPLRFDYEKNEEDVYPCVFFELLHTIRLDTKIYLVKPHAFAQYKNEAFAFDVFADGKPMLFSAAKDKYGRWMMLGPGDKNSDNLFIHPAPIGPRDRHFPNGFSLRMRVRIPGLGSTHYFVEPNFLKVHVYGELLNGYVQNTSGLSRKIFTLIGAKENWSIKIQ